MTHLCNLFYSFSYILSRGYVMKTRKTKSYRIYAYLIILIIIIICISIRSYSQTTFEFAYGKNGEDWGQDIKQTPDSGYIVTGETSYGHRNRDVFLLKLDKFGSFEWFKVYGGDLRDKGESLYLTSDGGYIIAGFTESFGAGNKDVYLIKTDVNGNLQWSKTFGGIENDFGLSVIETSDSGFVVTGFTLSYGAGNYDVYLLKCDKNGNLQWSRTFGGSAADYGYSVIETNNAYVISGCTKSYTSGKEDIYIISTDKSGNLNWANAYGSNLIEIAYDIQETPDKGFILTGVSHKWSTGNRDAFLLRTDSAGGFQWMKTYGISTQDLGFHLDQTTDGGFVITGWVTGIGNGYDVALIKTDDSGTFQWAKTYGGWQYEIGHSIQQTSDNGYIITGQTKTYGAGDNDIYVVKTDSIGFNNCNGTIEDPPVQNPIPTVLSGAIIDSGAVVNTPATIEETYTPIITIPCAVVPVEITSFNGYTVNNQIHLSWITASESNNDYFVIERSNDGQDFKAIGTVQGAGNSSSDINYSLVDYQPETGTNYYRLKQVDFDGQFKYYPALVAVEFNQDNNGNNKFYIYPNPSNGEIININTLLEDEILVVLYNLIGEIVFSKVALLENGHVVIAMDNYNKLAPGVYLIIGSSENEIYKQKLVIQ